MPLTYHRVFTQWKEFWVEVSSSGDTLMTRIPQRRYKLHVDRLLLCHRLLPKINLWVFSESFASCLKPVCLSLSSLTLWLWTLIGVIKFFERFSLLVSLRPLLNREKNIILCNFWMTIVLSIWGCDNSTYRTFTLLYSEFHFSKYSGMIQIYTSQLHC